MHVGMCICVWRHVMYKNCAKLCIKWYKCVNTKCLNDPSMPNTFCHRAHQTSTYTHIHDYYLRSSYISFSHTGYLHIYIIYVYVYTWNQSVSCQARDSIKHSSGIYYVYIIYTYITIRSHICFDIMIVVWQRRHRRRPIIKTTTNWHCLNVLHIYIVHGDPTHTSTKTMRQAYMPLNIRKKIDWFSDVIFASKSRRSPLFRNSLLL